MKVMEFKGQWRWLSNFYPCVVFFDGEQYPSVEHAYQASKTNDLTVRQAIRRCDTGGAAKRMSKTCRLGSAPETERLQMMRELVEQKFNKHLNPLLHGNLFVLNAESIEEGNTWGDTFWGTCNGEGQNHLGRIIMDIRKAML